MTKPGTGQDLLLAKQSSFGRAPWGQGLICTCRSGAVRAHSICRWGATGTKAKPGRPEVPGAAPGTPSTAREGQDEVRHLPGGHAPPKHTNSAPSRPPARSAPEGAASSCSPRPCSGSPRTKFTARVGHRAPWGHHVITRLINDQHGASRSCCHRTAWPGHLYGRKRDSHRCDRQGTWGPGGQGDQGGHPCFSITSTDMQRTPERLGQMTKTNPCMCISLYIQHINIYTHTYRIYTHRHT